MAGLDPSPPGRPKAKYNGSAPASEDRARRRAGALRSWTESERLPYWPRAPPACWIDLGFLGPSRFCPGRPENKAWISLDFLGFSRPNRDFSMGYAAGSEESFFSALSPGVRRAGAGACGLCMRKRRIVHGASLTEFLIFCKTSSRPVSVADDMSGLGSARSVR